MNSNDLAAIRIGAEIQNLQPYVDSEIASLQNAVVNTVLSAMNNGTLTADMALIKWMEYLSYKKLSQRFSQKVEVGKSVGATHGHVLDLTPKNG